MKGKMCKCEDCKRARGIRRDGRSPKASDDE
jgi:hypothetical protein